MDQPTSQPLNQPVSVLAGLCLREAMEGVLSRLCSSCLRATCQGDLSEGDLSGQAKVTQRCLPSRLCSRSQRGDWTRFPVDRATYVTSHSNEQDYFVPIQTWLKYRCFFGVELLSTTLTVLFPGISYHTIVYIVITRGTRSHALQLNGRSQSNKVCPMKQTSDVSQMVSISIRITNIGLTKD